jgi:hypothetical protein
MVLFAGPVFPEWYWGPLFFMLLTGPPLLVAALVVDRIVRRHLRLPLPSRGALAATVVVGGALCILLGQTVVREARFTHAARAEARTLDFRTYEPSPLPRPFTTERVDAFDGAVISRYGAGPGAYAFAYQQRPVEVRLQDGHCSLRRLAATGTSFFDGPCRHLRTPGGRDVYVGASMAIVDGGEAFSLVGGTLVRLSVRQVADRDVLAYFDSLRPIDKDDLEFKRG